MFFFNIFVTQQAQGYIMKFIAILFTSLLTITVYAADIYGPSDGLIALWTFDETEGKIAHDSSGNNHHLSLLGGAEFAPNQGIFNGAIRFDGKDSSAEDDDGHLYINGLSAFTVSVWVKSDVVTHDRGIFHGKQPDGVDSIFMLRYDSASWVVAERFAIIKAAITTTDNSSIHYESKPNIQDTVWQHLVLTWQTGNYMKLYIDGRIDDNPTYIGERSQGVISNAEKFIVGKGAKDHHRTSWIGLIDDMRIYNRVLTVDEISLLANTERTLIGDLNADGIVNIQDLVIVAINFGKDNPNPAADLNGDGVVNIQDLVIVAKAMQ